MNDRRDELQHYLKENGIATMVYYPVPLHKMKVFSGKCKMVNGLSHSERAAGEVLSLPIEPLMEEEEVLSVIGTIRAFFKKDSS